MTRRIDKPDTPADVELRQYLDTEQRPCFVMVAGAGSGKTTSLVKCLDHIGKKYGAEMRMRGQRVACITYTQVAVNEIHGDLGGEPLFHVSTIHSFLWTIVKPFQRDIKGWIRESIQEKLNEVADLGDVKTTKKSAKDKNEREREKRQRALNAIQSVETFKYEGNRDYSKGILGHDTIIDMVPDLIQRKPLLAKIVAQKFPFIMVDESQDTFPKFVEALRVIAQANRGDVCIGFFGDPMQKIYGSGVGDIKLDAGWHKITKPENFRCPTAVLDVLNKMRSSADKVQQSPGRHETRNGAPVPAVGTVSVFVLPSNDERSKNLHRVRSYLARKYTDANWANGAGRDLRVLVIAHRMAATQLGFIELFEKFNDDTSEALKSGFREGTTWVLKPFLDALLPMAIAFEQQQASELMALLRAHSPRLNGEPLKRVDNVAALLASLKDGVRELSELMSDRREATLLDVLRYAVQKQLVSLDERLQRYMQREDDEPSLSATSSSESSPERQQEKEDENDEEAIEAGLRCPARQIRSYRTYLNEDSPYSTQHGTKGAEFERVLVVLDDAEGRHNQYSYDKLFRLTELSKVDKANQDQGKETVLERTRRLFYVCCSRATRDLAIVLYTKNVLEAVEAVKRAQWFSSASICTLNDVLEAEPDHFGVPMLAQGISADELTATSPDALSDENRHPLMRSRHSLP